MAKGGFGEKWLEELKARNDIVEVIQKYINLTQKGKNYWGLCPFHHEKTPSFAVNAQEQFYHCFGCGVGGDVIRFIMEIENVDFYEACKQLAQRAGMKMPELHEDENTLAQKKRKEQMLLMMRDAARYYHANLRSEEGAPAREYLEKRGISMQTAVRFGIGYSTGFRGLIGYLKEKGYSEDLMLEAGIAEKKSSAYDALADRLIIPIFNSYGDVVAFGGRILEKVKFAKYKNTATTPLFDKSNTLYGLNFIKKVKNTEGLSSVIIVEGYMDVISLVQAGFTNVVASMGTSLTLSQARIIKRYAEKVYISYDGDGAGQTATLRGLDILKNQGLKVKVISLPDNLDPDDVIKKYGSDGYRKLIEEAKPLTEYKLSRLEPLLKDDPESRIEYASAALDVLRGLDNAVERETYLPVIRDKSGISTDYLRRELEVQKSSAPQQKPEAQKSLIEGDGAKSAYYLSARFVLYANLYGHKYIDDTESLLPYLEDDAHRDIMRYIESMRAKKEKIVIGNLFNVLDNTDELNVILGLNTRDCVDLEKYYNESVAKLKKRYFDAKIKNLSDEISAEKDLIKKAELLKQLNSLILSDKKRRS